MGTPFHHAVKNQFIDKTRIPEAQLPGFGRIPHIGEVTFPILEIEN
jgi:hypothetical protein